MKNERISLWLPLRVEGSIIYDGRNDEIFICDPDDAEDFARRVTTRYCNDLLMERTERKTK